MCVGDDPGARVTPAHAPGAASALASSASCASLASRRGPFMALGVPGEPWDTNPFWNSAARLFWRCARLMALAAAGSLAAAVVGAARPPATSTCGLIRAVPQC